MKNLSRFMFLILFACLPLAACQPAQGKPAGAESTLQSESTILEQPDAPSQPAAAEPAAALTIAYQEGSQFEITTPDGARIFIDVVNPAALSQPPSEKDVLLVTHSHRDHYSASFVNSFPGQKLVFEKGQVQLPGATIQGIVAAHNAVAVLNPEKGDNYIYIIDAAGLRFVHFGDIGQEALTPEQLAVLGEVDVACMQLANSYSDMSLDNKKGFNLMAQVKPRLVIPTHHNQDTAQHAVELWSGYYWDQGALPLSKDQLPAETRVLFMGQMAKAYGNLFGIPAWGGK